MRTWMLVLFLGCSEYNLNGSSDLNADPSHDTDDPVTGTDSPSTADYPGAISGRVCDPSGDGWVMGARVWIDLEDGTYVETFTDADGRFLLEDVPMGTWNLQIGKGSFGSKVVVQVQEALLLLAQNECLGDDLNIAVLAGDYDTTQELLDTLGLSYDLIAQGGTTQIDFLRNPARLESYDIVFLNCGMDEEWIYEAKEAVAANLQSYVQGGHSLYASDWTFQAIEAAFPEAVDFFGEDDFPSDAYSGDDGHLLGTVLDPNMQAVLGTSSADIHYDLAGWVIAVAADSSTEVLVSGSPTTIWQEDPVANAPLAVRFEEGAGTVVFTTFHNEPQITLDMDAMLREIILSL
jgi:hypothetical protein